MKRTSRGTKGKIKDIRMNRDFNYKKYRKDKEKKSSEIRKALRARKK